MSPVGIIFGMTETPSPQGHRTALYVALITAAGTVVAAGITAMALVAVAILT